MTKSRFAGLRYRFRPWFTVWITVMWCMLMGEITVGNVVGGLLVALQAHAVGELVAHGALEELVLRVLHDERDRPPGAAGPAPSTSPPSTST